ncbi:hypothetical protein B0A52_04477 [Exophiala mesophila]|uniref:Uncharacterized protein n=1 Tax=Exophiala mesophila TaxID=212818 RepID=A0A438N914_EXOME|nr:hypothetical protein B0A52_04477 [Exophiala mesophila]
MATSQTAPPPSLTHTTARLTHLEAHAFLSEFLTQADVRPGYRPDSTLTEHGPQAVSSGSNPNLTLHHLKRILLGMEGKKVGGGLDLVGAEDGEETGAESKTSGNRNTDTDQAATPRRAKRKIYDGADGDATAEAAAGNGAEWQEKDDFELAQDDDGIDLMNEDRHPGADLDQPHDDAQEEDLVNIEIEETGEKVDPRKQIDKDERKRLKKLKHKGDKAERSKKRKTT